MLEAFPGETRPLFARCLQDPASLARMPTPKRWWRFPPIVTSVFIAPSRDWHGQNTREWQLRARNANRRMEPRPGLDDQGGRFHKCENV